MVDQFTDPATQAASLDATLREKALKYALDNKVDTDTLDTILTAANKYYKFLANK